MHKRVYVMTAEGEQSILVHENSSDEFISTVVAHEFGREHEDSWEVRENHDGERAIEELAQSEGGG